MSNLGKYLAEQLIQEIENITDYVVVYAGRFQPFHEGHFKTYQHLVNKFGKDNVYIGTSDKTDKLKSPFNFKEKQTIMRTMFGVPSNKIVQIKNPYAPTEILKNFDENTTAFITVVGEKDEARLGGKYFSPYNGNLEAGYKDRGYVYAAPAQPNAISGTDVRNWLGKGDTEDRKKLFTKAYPKFNDKIFNLITSKLDTLNESVYVDAGEPETAFYVDGSKRILNAAKPENWFKQGGYTQLDKPKSDYMRGKGKSKDTESQFRKVTYKIKGVAEPVKGKASVPYQVDKWKNVTPTTLKKKTERYWDLTKVNEELALAMGYPSKQQLIQKQKERDELRKKMDKQGDYYTKVEEDITIPIKVGDTVLGGKFKNKKITVKDIGKNEKGDITINGKPLLKYRLIDESVEETINEELGQEALHSIAQIIASGTVALVAYLLPVIWGGIKNYIANVKDMINPTTYTQFTNELSKDKSFNKKFLQLLIKHGGTKGKKYADLDEFGEDLLQSKEFNNILDKYYPLNKSWWSNGDRNEAIREFRIGIKTTITKRGSWIVNTIKKKFPEETKDLQVESILSEIPMDDLQQIDKFADKQMNPLDVVITDKHFLDRLVDPRNKKPISTAELLGFFKRLARQKDKFAEFLKKYGEIVAKDNRTKINIPFMKQANKAIAKTIMRKDDFKTPSPELKFEDKISGGLSSSMSLRDIAKKHNVDIELIKSELKKGIKVEKEHTADIKIASEIAKDHLVEDPNYYTKLAGIESPTVKKEYTMMGSHIKKSAPMQGLDDELNELTKGNIFGGKIKIGGESVPIEVELLGADNKKKVFITKIIGVDKKWLTKLPKDGVLEIPARIFRTPGGGWYKIKTPSGFNESILSEGGDYVTCMECGTAMKQIQYRHLQYKHGMSMDEYKDKYPTAILVSESVKNMGNKNPMKNEENKKIHKAAVNTKEYKNKISESLKGKNIGNIRIDNIERNQSTEFRKKVSEGVKNSYITNPKLKDNRSEIGKKYGFGNTKTLETMYSSGKWTRPENKDEFQLYSERVRRLSDLNYQKFFNEIENAKQRGSDFHLDHKYSIKEAFDNNIPLEVVSHYKNLEVIDGRLNESKGSNSSIKLNELINDIQNSTNPLDTRTLLLCGGAYGHMSHPFDIDINLTFGQLKDIVKKALTGELELTREKCIAGDTIIHTEKNGDMIIAEFVDNGIIDKVLSFNEETGNNEYMDVIASFNNDTTDEWLEIELEDGKTIQVTPNHRMYVEGIGYVEAKDLTEDMELKIF